MKLVNGLNLLKEENCNNNNHLIFVNRFFRYQEWKKKHRMEIPKEGESENNSLVNKFGQLNQRWKMKNTNTHKRGTVSAARAPKAELKSRDQIRKERKYKEKEKRRLALKRSSREKNKRRNNNS